MWISNWNTRISILFLKPQAANTGKLKLTQESASSGNVWIILKIKIHKHS